MTNSSTRLPNERDALLANNFALNNSDGDSPQNIGATPWCLQRFFSPTTPTPGHAKLKNVFLPSLLESTVGVGYSLGLVCFMAVGTPWYLYPFTLTTALMALNFSVRMVEQFAIANLTNNIIKFALLIAKSTAFALVDTNTRDLLLHESGHALFAISAFKDAHPKITITPSSFFINSGITACGDSCDRDQLTAFGNKIGVDNCFALLHAAGPLMTQVWNFLALMVAQALPNNQQTLKMYIRMCVALSTISTTAYSLSPYYYDCETIDSNDFCNLEKSGISPAVAAVVILSSMLLLQIIMSSVSYANRCYKTHSVAEDLTPDSESVPLRTP